MALCRRTPQEHSLDTDGVSASSSVGSHWLLLVAGAGVCPLDGVADARGLRLPATQGEPGVEGGTPAASVGSTLKARPPSRATALLLSCGCARVHASHDVRPLLCASLLAHMPPPTNASHASCHQDCYWEHCAEVLAPGEISWLRGCDNPPVKVLMVLSGLVARWGRVGGRAAVRCSAGGGGGAQGARTD